jgi:hypothetical protein
MGQDWPPQLALPRGGAMYTLEGENNFSRGHHVVEIAKAAITIVIAW